MKIKSVKISVIVPVYNVEKYLEKCVESLLNQSLKDIEIILVDDGSPDNCPQICDEYATKDSRVKVCHKQNGGLLYTLCWGFKDGALWFIETILLLYLGSVVKF